MSYAISTRPFRSVRHPAIDSIFDGFYSQPYLAVRKQEKERSARPAADIYETKQQYQLFIDLPGIKKEQVSLDIKDGERSLQTKIDHSNQEAVDASAENGAERNAAEKLLLRRERTQLNYARKFLLDESVDIDAVSAEMVDGVLTITLPKTAPVDPGAREVRIN